MPNLAKRSLVRHCRLGLVRLGHVRSHPHRHRRDRPPGTCLCPYSHPAAAAGGPFGRLAAAHRTTFTHCRGQRGSSLFCAHRRLLPRQRRQACRSGYLAGANLAGSCRRCSVQAFGQRRRPAVRCVRAGGYFTGVEDRPSAQPATDRDKDGPAPKLGDPPADPDRAAAANRCRCRQGRPSFLLERQPGCRAVGARQP